MNTLEEIFAKIADPAWRAAHTRSADDNTAPYMRTEPTEEQRREQDRLHANVPPLYHHVVPASEAPKRGRLYVGKAGVGKTHAAIADMLALAKLGRRCLFLSMPAYTAALRSHEDVPSIRTLTGLDVVVLDDLAQAKPAEWQRDSLYTLVDGLLSYQVLVIATSNQNRREIAEAYGDAIASRLYALCPDRLDMQGKDRRLVPGGAA